MSDSPLDSTRVMDMMKEFEIFLGGPSSSKYSRKKYSSFSPTKSDSKFPTFDSPNSEMKRKLVQKEAEVNHLQVIIEKMKAASKTEEPAAKRACIELEKTAECNKQMYEREKEKTLQLSHQLQLMEKESQSLRASLAASIDQAKTLNQQLEAKLSTSYKKINLLQVELEELKIDNNDTVKQLQFEVNRLKGELELADDKANQLREQMKIVTKQMQEKCAMEKNMLQIENDTKIRELEQQLTTMEDDAVIVKAMRGELTRLKEKEKDFISCQHENQALLKRQENTLLLKENVSSLEAELATERKRSNTVHQLTMENNTLRQRLTDWEALGSVHGETRSPSTISQYLSRLQKSEVLLQEESGQLRAELSVLKATADELRTECNSAKADNDKFRQTLSTNSNLMRKVHRKQLLLTKECESYKRIINSYENEVTMNISAGTAERVSMLESLVSQYKTTLNQMCSENPVAVTAEREATLQSEINSLRQTVSQLQEELQKMKVKEKSMASSERIFHFSMNPTDLALKQRTDKLQHLQEENQKLKIRIQVLEERGSDATDITAQVQQRSKEQGSPLTIESLQEQLKAAETKNKRFLDAFKKTSKEFREVCYILTGYRIDSSSQNKYKLSHMYAESPDDFLLFQKTSEDQLQLLETNYSKTLTSLIQLHLMNQNSIPAFLSGLTMELFNNQTLMLSQQSLQ